MLKEQAFLELYTAPIPEDLRICPVHPKQRNDEIALCKNERLQREKYAVWKLLERGIFDILAKGLDEISFTKNENGKWECKELFFSLSHSDGMVAAALSSSPVGVDIESLESIKSERLQNRIFSESELAVYNTLDGSQKKLFILESWTQKESRFKQIGGKTFVPSSISSEHTKSVFLEKDGKTYSVSVCSDKCLDRLSYRSINQIG